MLLALRTALVACVIGALQAPAFASTLPDADWVIDHVNLVPMTANLVQADRSVVVRGGLIVAIGFSLGGPTGWAINPARDLGPRIAHAFLPIPGKGDSDWPYSWVPVVGPIAGGVSAALFYTAVFG